MRPCVKKGVTMGDYLGIVDVDSILYKVAYMSEGEEVEQAKLSLNLFLSATIAMPTNCEKYIFCLSGGHSGRDEIAKTKPYKGNRKQLTKPEHFAALREYLEVEYNALTIKDYEADDLVVSIHDRYKSSSVLIGIDKDNLQSSGKHFNYDKQQFIIKNDQQSEYALACQMLTGDAGDNIPGIPGVGTISAEKILNGYDQPYIQTVFNYYMDSPKAGKSAIERIAYFKEQYKLLKMKKDIFYPFELHFVDIPEVSINCADEFDEL